MNFHSLRSYLAAFLALSGAALLLTACGGGGASSNPAQGGPVSIAPQTGTLYAGVPVTFALQGGRRPYVVTSSEPSLLPVPQFVHGTSFTTIPNNPGVVDVGLEPGELPSRTVLITVRDSTGVLVQTGDLRVAQNFLTGYGVSFTPTICPAPASATALVAQACAGGETAVRMQATFNGNLAGNRQFRFEVLRGNFSFRNPATGQVAQSVLLTSDHSGSVLATIEVPFGVPTQLATMRVIDVATGVYADTVFTITSAGATPTAALTAIPNEFTFTGALSDRCGTGSAEFLVFDGTPPYTAVSAFAPNITVTPTVSNSNPGRFTVSANNAGTCISNGTIVITDSRGGRTTVTVTTEPGTTDPTPPPAFAVGPTSLTLGCGQSGSVQAVGGSGTYTATSTNPNVAVSVSGGTITITRAGPAGPGSGGTQSVGIGVSDGRSILNVTATVPTTCP